MGYSERVKEIRHYFQLNQKEFAELLNTARTALSEYEGGSREPSKDFFIALSNIGVSIDWFVTGKGVPFLPKADRLKRELFGGNNFYGKKLQNEPLFPLPNGENGATIEGSGDGGTPADSAGKEPMKADVARTDMRGGEIPLIYPGDERLKQGIIIPYLEDQKVSAGHGAELEDEERPSRYFRVPAYLGRYPDLATLPVKGDSMDPTLHDGDLVVCDGGGWDGDGIYVIKTSDEAFIKRVVSTSQGYQVISDNKTYPSYGESKRDVTIVGKVRAALIAIPGRRGGI
jgi:phage repressor protein C with HTH and peptisase S24 domain